MIYLAVDPDAKGEGIGSAIQYNILSYALSRNLGIGYTFLGLRNVGLFQKSDEYDIESWSKKWESYFNFPKANIPEGYETTLLEGNAVKEIERYVKNPPDKDVVLVSSFSLDIMHSWNVNYSHVSDLAPRLQHEFSINKSYYNVSVHMRSFTKYDSCTSPLRCYFTKENSSYYNNLISTIRGLPTEKDKLFHIHIQTSPAEVEFLKDLDINYIIYENCLPWNSLSCMIQSDLLCASNSAFSFVAHLLSPNRAIFRENILGHGLFRGDILIACDNGKTLR